MRVLRTIGISIIAILFLIIISFVGLNIYLEERLLDMSSAYLERELNVNVDVESMSLSLIKGFPRATVNLRGVSIERGSLDWPKEFEPGLLSLAEVSLQVNLINAINNIYNVDNVILKDGWINLYFDNKGDSNFEIFSDTSSTSSEWLMNLDMLALDNVKVNYIDIRTGWIFKGEIERGRLRGAFSANKYELTIRSSIRINTLRQRNFYYLSNRKLVASGSLVVNPNTVTFSRANVRIEDNSFNLTGSIGRGVGSDVSLTLEGTSIKPDFIISFLSQYQLNIPNNIRWRGDAGFNLSVVGEIKMDKPYKIEGNFRSDYLSFNLPDRPKISIKRLNGNFTNGHLGSVETTQINIPSLEVSCNNSIISGSIKARNMERPIYHIKLKQNINVSDLDKLGFNTFLKSGFINGDFESLGHIENLDSLTIDLIKDAKIFSNIEFSNISTIPSEQGSLLSDASGSFLLNNREIESLSISGLLMNSKFTAIGQVSNATGFLINEGKASVNASVTMDTLNTSWLLAMQSDEHKSEPSDTSFVLWDAVSYISGNYSLKSFIHGNFSASPLGGSFFLSDDRISIRDLTGSTCGGDFSGSLNSSKSTDGVQQSSSNVSFKNVNISNLFYSFGNFGQSVISHNQIEGKLTGNLAIEASLLKGKVQLNDLKARANITIQDGALKEVEQLEALSRFVELEELRHIKFQTLTNSVTIDNRRLLIPNMEINSSALNLSLSGEHHFDGYHLYQFQMALSDVLFRKASRSKRQDQEFGVEEDDGTGRTRLFLKVEGDSISSNVSYDRSSAWQQFRRNLRREREILTGEPKHIIEGEPTEFEIEWEDKAEEVEAEGETQTKDSQPVFEIEWDDN